METVDILFFINLGLALCAIVELTTHIVLCKKTVCRFQFGVAAVAMFVFGLITYIVQLILYVHSRSSDAAAYSVYACIAVLGTSFVVASVYLLLLGQKAGNALCFMTGVFNLAPPVGMIFTVMLSYSMRRDTDVQALVYNGYAYTYAALGSFSSKNEAEFIDAGGEEKFEPLTPKAAHAHLKRLKKQAKTPEGLYNYGAAIAYYTPQNMRNAVNLMTKSAKGGYAPALYNLGYYYETGTEVKKNVKKAREYYELALQAGDSDADTRLTILSICEGNAEEGVGKFRGRAEAGDHYAKYNLAVCYERGQGVEQDLNRAIELYEECANDGMFAAQKRYFAIAARDINSPQNGHFFRELTDRDFNGTFAVMINGLIEIKKRHAADSAEYFLEAVKRRDKWEGVARCLVGTLYIDCGKLLNDRRNGAAYIKSAFGLTPIAKEIYATVRKNLTDKKRNSVKNSNKK